MVDWSNASFRVSLLCGRPSSILGRYGIELHDAANQAQVSRHFAVNTVIDKSWRPIFLSNIQCKAFWRSYPHYDYQVNHVGCVRTRGAEYSVALVLIRWGKNLPYIRMWSERQFSKGSITLSCAVVW